MMTEVAPENDFESIPGTYVQDAAHYQNGYGLNMFCMSLNNAENRAKFKDSETAYIDQFDMSPAQRTAVLERDWLGMLQLGGNIYYTFKIAAFDGLNMQQVGAKMSGTGMRFEDFQQMMLNGGRPIDGNRYKGETDNG
jgi:protocatechuate 4,5-dioxygenase alpha chain